VTQIGSVQATGPQAAPTQDRASLEKAAKAFEAIFMRQMIGAMRSASLGEGITDSAATEQFRDMADSKTADAMAQTGSMGIADLLLRQLGQKVSPLTPAKTGSAK
jgi:flagellar protein FlgJ